MEKCYQLFLSGIRNEKTRKKYEYYLQRFLNESKIKDFSALIELDDDTRQDIGIPVDGKVTHPTHSK